MDIVGPKCGPRVGLDPAPRDTGHRRARGLQVAIPNLPERHASNLRVSLSSSGNGALHQLIGRAGFDHAPKPSSGACCRGCALMAADPVAGTLQEGLGVGLGPEGEGDACSLDPQGELSGWLVESRGTQAATDCVEPRCDSSVGEGPGELGECRRSRGRKLDGVSPGLQADQRDATAATNAELNVSVGEQMGPTPPLAHPTDIPRRPERRRDLMESRASVQWADGRGGAELGQDSKGGHAVERATSAAATCPRRGMWIPPRDGRGSQPLVVGRDEDGRLVADGEPVVARGDSAAS